MKRKILLECSTSSMTKSTRLNIETQKLNTTPSIPSRRKRASLKRSQPIDAVLLDLDIKINQWEHSQ